MKSDLRSMPSTLTAPDYMRLLPPWLIAKIGRFDLLARGVVEGFISGRHRSPHKGFSVEFAEHRQYVPGDDLRALDWRVYGKTDRYYIKEFLEETNMRVTILLDCSGSMRYTGDNAAMVDGQRLSKFEYGRFLAAALAYLLINQQDAVGLVTFDTRVRRYLPARAQTGQIRRILQELHETEPGGETALAPVLHEIAERIHRRGMVIVIGDLFDDAEMIVKALHHFHFKRHEIVVLHTMADEELTFPFGSFTHFKDLEPTDNLFEIDPKTIRARYLDSIRSFVDRIQTGCGRLHADYVPMSTKQPFDDSLMDYLAGRMRSTK